MLDPTGFSEKLVNASSKLLPREETGKQFDPSSLNNLEWPQKEVQWRNRDISFIKPDQFTPNKTGEMDGIRGEAEHTKMLYKIMVRKRQNQVQTLKI